MQRFFLRLATTLIAVSASVSISSPTVPNQLLNTLTYGKLSHFWAQEACAIPEAHAYLGQLQRDGFSLASPTVAIIDSGFHPQSILSADVGISDSLRADLAKGDNADHIRVILAQDLPPQLRDIVLPLYAQRVTLRENVRHGTAVFNLLAGTYGASTTAKVKFLAPFPHRVSFAGNVAWHSAMQHLPEPFPQVINHSQAFYKYDKHRSLAIGQAIRPLVRKTLFVTSAGNYSQEPIEAAKRELAQEIIIVGSTDPTGHVSSFSQRGDAETIRAFSDSHIQTIDAYTGDFTDFGGTSGSAPLVSGALADTLAILPNLNRDSAVLLLQNTAIASSYGDKVGTLNSYKLLRVAKRVHDRGQFSSEEPEILHTSELYDFRAEARQLANDAQTATPSEALAKLRLAFFLDQKNTDIRKYLATSYRQAGYEAQAFFYDTPAQEARDLFILEKQDKQARALTDFWRGLARGDLETAEELLPFFAKKMLTSNSLMDILLTVDRTTQAKIIDFMRDHRLAEITIYEDGDIDITMDTTTR